MELITVFTPTYNRADLLPRGYQALKKQTSKNFIWMIIDDGSTDRTKELVDEFIADTAQFRIVYIKKENGGLHTGYNTAIEHAETELMVCIDSDDFMPEDAIEKIERFWMEKGSAQYAGIVGLDYDLENNLIGDPLPRQKTVNLIDLLVGRYKLNNGDRTNVVRTELYKKVAPMKAFAGEKNFNPHYLHLLISKEYDFLVLNENLRYVEYQEAGMTNSIWKQYCNSPNSFAETRKLYLSFEKTPVKFKIKNIIHYISSCILAGKSPGEIFEIRQKIALIICFPLGFAMALITKRKGREPVEPKRHKMY